MAQARIDNNLRDKKRNASAGTIDVTYKDPFKHPRHRIAQWVVIGVFIIGGVLTFIYGCEVYSWNNKCEQKALSEIAKYEPKDPSGIVVDLKTIWEFLIPLLTLVLGYEFGKSEHN